eukprot:13883151-Alexandrium_andersonii.AAC.1
MVLPPSWPEHGIYVVTCENGQVFVSNRYTKEKKAMVAEALPAFKEVGDLQINNNWSETRAKLVSKSCVEHGGVNLVSMLPNAICDTTIALPSPPRAALARSKSS